MSYIQSVFNRRSGQQWDHTCERRKNSGGALVVTLNQKRKMRNAECLQDDVKPLIIMN